MPRCPTEVPEPLAPLPLLLPAPLAGGLFSLPARRGAGFSPLATAAWRAGAAGRDAPLPVLALAGAGLALAGAAFEGGAALLGCLAGPPVLPEGVAAGSGSCSCSCCSGGCHAGSSTSTCSYSSSPFSLYVVCRVRLLPGCTAHAASARQLLDGTGLPGLAMRTRPPVSAPALTVPGAAAAALGLRPRLAGAFPGFLPAAAPSSSSSAGSSAPGSAAVSPAWSAAAQLTDLAHVTAAQQRSEGPCS